MVVRFQSMVEQAAGRIMVIHHAVFNSLEENIQAVKLAEREHALKARQVAEPQDEPSEGGRRRGEGKPKKGGGKKTKNWVNDLTPDQLRDAIAELRKEQFNLRFQKAGGQLGKTARVRQVRRDIARIKTLQAQRSAAPAAK